MFLVIFIIVMVVFLFWKCFTLRSKLISCPRISNCCYTDTNINLKDCPLIDKIELSKQESLQYLTAGISHDLNNMMANLNLSSFLIKEFLITNAHIFKGSDEFAICMDNVDNIIEGTKKTEIFAKQLLTFSKKSTLSLKVMDLSVTIKDSISFLSSTLKMSGLKVISRCECRSMVLGDPTHLHLLLQNLILNSKDALLEKKSNDPILVEVSIKEITEGSVLSFSGNRLKTGKYCVLSVRDKGVGISKDNFKHIFKPYFTSKPVGKGTGLGMAIVKTIIDNHKSFISIESSDKGTNINVYFPFCSDEDSRDIFSSTRLKLKSVAILTENSSSIEILEKFLKVFYHIDVYVTTSVDTLCDKLSDGSITSIILNDRVPDFTSAFAAYNRLQDIYPNHLYFFINGYKFEKDLSEILSSNSKAYVIQKPFRKDNLDKVFEK